MGQYSWIYSNTDKQVVNNRRADTYLLVPEKFQEKYGEWIYEPCYSGYGNFGLGYDIFELVLEFNKEMIPEIIRRMKRGTWKCEHSEKDMENLMNFYEGKAISCEKRWLGILMACYDEDNFALEFPIKITSKPLKYSEALPSKGDPDQGWPEEDTEEDDDYYDYDDAYYYDEGTPSCTNGDYGPLNPWNAPGMSIKDFI